MTVTYAPARTDLPSLARMWHDAPLFTGLGLLLIFGLIPLGAAMALDLRVFQGESPWTKPVKFHFALAIYLITLAFFARYLPEGMRAGRAWRLYAAAVTGAVLGEVLWLWAAAQQNTAAHFNTEVPLFAALYPVMGVLAVLLTSASLTMGVAIWRNRAAPLPAPLRLSVALGLVLTFVTTVVVAGYLSSTGSHFVGSSTRVLWLMGWSRDAGDLRVAHFFATHALHAVPLAGWLATRTLPEAWATRAVLLAAGAYAALVAGSFAQALAGQPFLPALG